MKKRKCIGSKRDLTNRVVLITGGLGMLGSQFADILSMAGASVALVDIRQQNKSRGSRKIPYQADITKFDEVKIALNQIQTDLGTPSILINCAGLDSPPSAPVNTNGPFEDYAEETWDAVMDSHLKGAFLVSREFIRHFKTARLNKGSIVNISSDLGLVAPNQKIYEYRRKRGENFFKPVAYSVAKAGMIGFTRWLAGYSAPLGIRVNALAPGGVYNHQDPEFVQAYNQRTMLGRMAKIDDYNEAILFLASDASEYMTGAVLSIDGGSTAL